MKNKAVYIIAGPNGSGKTTFAKLFLPDYVNCPNFVNADLIAQGKAQLTAKAYSQAFTFFGQAKAKTQEIKVLIEAKTDFEDEDENEDKDDDKDKDNDEDTLEERRENNRGSGKIKIDIGL